MSNQTKTAWDNEKAGVLWSVRKSAKGTEYQTGSIKLTRDLKAGEELKIIVFPTRDKKNDNAPDWTMYVSKPKEGDYKPSASSNQTPAVKKAPVTPKPAVEPIEESGDIL